ncbi:hypothetical protein [Acidiplasma aeolicum]
MRIGISFIALEHSPIAIKILPNNFLDALDIIDRRVYAAIVILACISDP